MKMLDWSKYKRAENWKAFIAYLGQGERPTEFKEVWKRIHHVCRMYQVEALALWNIIRSEEIRAVCEIGRGRSASSFLLACAARDLRWLRTVDIVDFEESDRAFKDWLEVVGLTGTIEVADSGTLKADRLYDLVWVDGSHMDFAVAADIEIWRHHTRLMGFHDYGQEVYKREWPGVAKAVGNYNWKPIGVRGHSDIVFDVGNQFWRCESCRELFLPELTAGVVNGKPHCAACMFQAEGLE